MSVFREECPYYRGVSVFREQTLCDKNNIYKFLVTVKGFISFHQTPENWPTFYMEDLVACSYMENLGVCPYMKNLSVSIRRKAVFLSIFGKPWGVSIREKPYSVSIHEKPWDVSIHE